MGIYAQTDHPEALTKFTATIRGEASAKRKLPPFAKVTYVESIPAQFPDFTTFDVTY